MHFILRSFFLTVALVSLAFSFGASSAQADIVYLKDRENGFSVSFPDRWRARHNQKSDDVLTVLAPGHNEHAVCRIRVRGDRRFVVYPPRFAMPVQSVAYGKDFWDTYLGEYDDVFLQTVTNVAALGDGFASYAEAFFVTAVGPAVEKRGIMFASLHGDRAYIVDCSSTVESYEKWRKSFLSFVKSINFTRGPDAVPIGHYRNFMADRPVRIQGARALDVTYY